MFVRTPQLLCMPASFSVSSHEATIDCSNNVESHANRQTVAQHEQYNSQSQALFGGEKLVHISITRRQEQSSRRALLFEHRWAQIIMKSSGCCRNE